MERPCDYVIYAPGYNPDCGGTIALHKLCSTINNLGFTAKIWPEKKPFFNWELGQFLKSIERHIRYRRKINLGKPYEKTNPAFLTPLAKQSDLTHAVVVYPEVVSGNPLNADKVVRWLLHKPGFHGGKTSYGKNDLFFLFNRIFDDPLYNTTPGHQLEVTHILTEIYKKTNFGERAGGCYLVRKGKNRDLTAHPSDYIKIDGLPHEEIADLFNKCEFFISYDAYTMYLQYAALCGCIPVVIPEPGVSKNQVYPNERNCYGVAYGFDDIPNAIKEVDKLKADLADRERASRESVTQFIRASQQYFYGC